MEKKKLDQNMKSLSQKKRERDLEIIPGVQQRRKTMRLSGLHRRDETLSEMVEENHRWFTSKCEGYDAQKEAKQTPRRSVQPKTPRPSWVNSTKTSGAKPSTRSHTSSTHAAKSPKKAASPKKAKAAKSNKAAAARKVKTPAANASPDAFARPTGPLNNPNDMICYKRVKRNDKRWK